jgi:Tol biopolymer transport system component
MNEDGSQQTDLLTASTSNGGPTYRLPSWSSDAHSIVYVHKVGTSPVRLRVEAGDVDLSTGTARLLNNRVIAEGGSSETGYTHGIWSPTRDEIALIRITSTAASIWLAPSSGSTQPTQIYTIPNGHNAGDIQWSPSGDSRTDSTCAAA